MIIRRQALLADVLTPIEPPIHSTQVNILNVANGFSDDLYVYSLDSGDLGDADKYLIVTAGFERALPMHVQRNSRILVPNRVCFYLRIAHNATVVLVWS